MNFRSKASLLSICMVIAAFATAAGAADTFEPWDPGLSDLELYISNDDQEGWANQFLLGYGLPYHLSAGLAWGRELVIAESGQALGGLIAWTPLERGLDLDLFGQYEHSFLTPSDSYLVGAEVSRHGVGERRLVPYTRLFWGLERGSGEEEQAYYALVGLLLNLGRSGQILGEAQETFFLREQPQLHLALGLNLKLTGDLELITEIRHDRASEASPCTAFTVGVIATLEELGKKTALRPP